MKILSDSEYEALIEQKQKNNEESYYKDEYKKLDKIFQEYKINSEKSIAEIEKNFKKEIENLEKDQEIVLTRKDQEVENKIHVATEDLKREVQKLTIENNNNKKEVEIMTTAFKNVGFDVKDMKGILDKLVEGMVSKNTINVVK